MGKGGKSSSSTTTTTTNTNGQSAIQGDNLGVVLSGVNDSDLDIDLRLTDHGAIESAENIASKALNTTEWAVDESLDFAEEAVESNEKVTMAALESNSKALDKSLDFGSESLSKALDFGGDALDNMRQNSADTVAAVKQMAVQSGENARAALAMAENTASRSQTGNSGDMSKVVIAVAGVFGLAMTVMAFRG